MTRRRVKWVRQIADDDCGAAALAMCCKVGHAEALAAFGQFGEPIVGEGASNGDLIVAASMLGVTLKPHFHQGAKQMREIAEQVDRAVLTLRWERGTKSHKESPYGHFVYIDRGLVYDPSSYEHWKSHHGTGRTLSTYFRRRPGRVHTVMEVV